MARGGPMRVRISVRRAGNHIGYATIITYPDRDITAFNEGSPYSEVVISDLAERHVALLQRFKAHWLIHCAIHYSTTQRAGELTTDQILELANVALQHQHAAESVRAEVLRAQVDGLLM